MNEKANNLVTIAYEQIGSPYVFGTWGQECTPDLRKRYASYNPEHKDAIYKACQRLSSGAKTCDGCRYKGRLAFDCRGFTNWCLKQADIVTLTGSGCTEQYNTTKNWSKKGLIKNMPDLPCILFQYRSGRYQHTGIYVGNGRIVHASTGVIESKITTAWTHYALPKGLYTSKEVLNADPMPYLTTLKKGSEGALVKELQRLLQKKGYYTGELDGKFGTGTQDAVKNFQRDMGLTVDGVVGDQTWEALKAEEYKTVITITKGGTIRQGDWAKSTKVRTAGVGAVYDWVATSALSGYYGFRDEKRVLWIAPKYAKLSTVKREE